MRPLAALDRGDRLVADQALQRGALPSHEVVLARRDEATLAGRERVLHDDERVTGVERRARLRRPAAGGARHQLHDRARDLRRGRAVGPHQDASAVHDRTVAVAVAVHLTPAVLTGNAAHSGS